jgi:hypothetical protein
MSAFIARLTDALGPKGVSTDAHEIDPHISDWRGRWKGSTPVLVKPSSTEEVSAAMTLCMSVATAEQSSCIVSNTRVVRCVMCKRR